MGRPHKWADRPPHRSSPKTSNGLEATVARLTYLATAVELGQLVGLRGFPAPVGFHPRLKLERRSAAVGLRAVQPVLDQAPVLFQVLERPAHGPEERLGIIRIVPALHELQDQLALPLEPFASERDALGNVMCSLSGHNPREECNAS